MYRFQTADPLANIPDVIGASGVTPTRSGFQPSATYVEGGQTVALGPADLAAERVNLEAQRNLQQLETTDAAFEEGLREVIRGGGDQRMVDRCRALLQLVIVPSARLDREAYQRVLMAGNTTDEVSYYVREMGHMLAGF